MTALVIFASLEDELVLPVHFRAPPSAGLGNHIDIYPIEDIICDIRTILVAYFLRASECRFVIPYSMGCGSLTNEKIDKIILLICASPDVPVIWLTGVLGEVNEFDQKSNKEI